jgi:hypothetical protein
MWRMIAFAPVLAFVPVLLVVGIIFVVVPGGFIIVLGAVFYASLALFGAVAAAAKTRWGAARSKAPRDHTTSAHGYSISQPGYRPASLGTPALQPALRAPVTGVPAGHVAAAATLQPTAQDRAAEERRRRAA